MQIMSMMQSGKIAPNQIMGMLSNVNPQLAQAWQMANKMAQGKTPEQMAQVAQNLCQQKGIDFQQAQQMFGSIKK